MDKFDKKKLTFYENHSREFTRRQFLYNSGLTSVASYLTISSLPQMFASKAYAQSPSLERKHIPFVSIECAGGINLAGNVIVGRDSKTGTQNETSTLDSYLLMGFPPELHPKNVPLNEDFGLLFHPTSGILRGMKQVLENKTVPVNGSPVLISKMVDGLFFAYRSTDDSSENPLNTSIPAVKAGAHGSLANLIGNFSSSNGGYSVTDPFVYDPTLRPPVIINSKDAQNLSSLGKFMDENGNRTQFNSFMNRITNISKERLRMVSQSKLPSGARSNVELSMNKAGPFFDQYTPDLLTPRKMDAMVLDTVFPYVLQGDTTLQNYDRNQGLGNLKGDLDTIGTTCYLLFNDNLDGSDPLVGSASLVVGGGDYHDGTASTGVLKDQELGRYIGEIIYYAALKGKDVVIDLFTDGSAICDSSGVTDSSPLGQGRVVHYTDSPLQSGSIMIVYRHGKTREEQPIVKSIGGSTARQLGSFLPGKGGGVDLTANSFANNINMVWKIKMLNYLALMLPTDSAKTVIDEFDYIYKTRLGDDNMDLIRFNYRGKV